MQAIKQQHSPRGKTSTGSNGILDSGLPTVNKSVAQRVMDVAGDIYSSGQISPLRLGSKNSIESDQEIEEITCDSKPPAPIQSTNGPSNKSRHEPKEATVEGHKLSVIVPSTSCNQQQERSSNSNNSNTNATKANTSSEYHQVEDDDYESRYDNAAVEASANRRQELESQRQGSVSSIPESPKAKSAPATPCNVTPTAFHQLGTHLNSGLNPSPANTLPLDIRRNISATCRVLPRSIAGPYHNHQAISLQCLDELSRTGEELLKTNDYAGAIHAFNQWIELATKNQNRAYLKDHFMIYIHRAEAHAKMEDYNKAIDDSIAARSLNPQFIEAYYRQGQYQLRIGKCTDSLAVFAFGLAQDSTNKPLFEALVEAALSSSFRAEFEPKYKTLQELQLEQNKFIVVSVLGQCLLTQGNGEHAVIILESALKLGTDNKKWKSSVLSTISYAYCSMKDFEKAITYMQKELDIENELLDVVGQCRVLSNLGYTYYKMRRFAESLEAHRKQVNVAFRSRLYQKTSMGLNALGHVHVARNDFVAALTSHTRCLEILKQLGDNDDSQVKELLSIGHVHTMLNDYDAANERYKDATSLIERSVRLTQEERRLGLIMVNFNLAYLSLRKQSFSDTTQYYSKVLQLAEELNASDPKKVLFEMRACNGMGQTFWRFKQFNEARVWFERQKGLAEKIEDRAGQSQHPSCTGCIVGIADESCG